MGIYLQYIIVNCDFSGEFNVLRWRLIKNITDQNINPLNKRIFFIF
ncbi:protein of unknown function [Chryseobacterium sp. JV274]|nr:protein of unknown function [Chryseobacterium sp. JV274]